MAALLPSDNYPAVRAAIDITLDTAALPDSIIALDIYGGSAVRDVLAIDPTAASRSGDQLLHAQAAAVYFCAARLVGALPVLTQERNFAGDEYRRQAIDADARARDLLSLASAELDSYLEPTPATSDMPTMFAAGCGQRGRW